MSTILHGRFLMHTKPFLRRAEHCIGKVKEAPASALSKVSSCCTAGSVSLGRTWRDVVGVWRPTLAKSAEVVGSRCGLGRQLDSRDLPARRWERRPW